MGNKSEKAGKKICTKCGSEMKVREKRSGDDAGKKFWVCLKYPDCKSIEVFEVSTTDSDHTDKDSEDNSDSGIDVNEACNTSESSKTCDDIGEGSSESSNVSTIDNGKLYKCPACGNTISKNAKACTKCGEPNPLNKGYKFKILVAVAIIYVIVVAAYIVNKDFVFSKTTSQSRKFCSDVIRYKDRLEEQCQAACEKYACDIDNYLRDGYKIVSSSPNQIPVDIVTPYGDISGKCTCVGTEYILEK